MGDFPLVAQEIDTVYVDGQSEISGTIYPAGTREFPVNNMNDAVTIALARGYKTIKVLDGNQYESFKGMVLPDELPDGLTVIGNNNTVIWAFIQPGTADVVINETENVYSADFNPVSDGTYLYQAKDDTIWVFETGEDFDDAIHTYDSLDEINLISLAIYNSKLYRFGLLYDGENEVYIPQLEVYSISSGALTLDNKYTYSSLEHDDVGMYNSPQIEIYKGDIYFWWYHEAEDANNGLWQIDVSNSYTISHIDTEDASTFRIWADEANDRLIMAGSIPSPSIYCFDFGESSITASFSIGTMTWNPYLANGYFYDIVNADEQFFANIYNLSSENWGDQLSFPIQSDYTYIIAYPQGDNLILIGYDQNNNNSLVIGVMNETGEIIVEIPQSEIHTTPIGLYDGYFYINFDGQWADFIIDNIVSIVTPIFGNNTFENCLMYGEMRNIEGDITLKDCDIWGDIKFNIDLESEYVVKFIDCNFRGGCSIKANLLNMYNCSSSQFIIGPYDVSYGDIMIQFMGSKGTLYFDNSEVTIRGDIYGDGLCVLAEDSENLDISVYGDCAVYLND
jgi:hypothetical protein